jgi:hypothetical protein
MVYHFTVYGKCNHPFHMHCILKWLQSQNGAEQCPLCRAEWQYKDDAWCLHRSYPRREELWRIPRTMMHYRCICCSAKFFHQIYSLYSPCSWLSARPAPIRTLRPLSVGVETNKLSATTSCHMGSKYCIWTWCCLRTLILPSHMHGFFSHMSRHPNPHPCSLTSTSAKTAINSIDM